MTDQDNWKTAQELVGPGPSEPTNQPTDRDEPIMFCGATSLFYVGRGDRECKGELVVGSGTRETGAFQLAADWNPATLRAKLVMLESDERKLRFQVEAATLTGEVYQELATESTAERDRARETAMALEEELAAAKHNLAHVRESLRVTLNFVRDGLTGRDAYAEEIRRLCIGAHCEVCDTEVLDEVIPESDRHEGAN